MGDSGEHPRATGPHERGAERRSEELRSSWFQTSPSLATASSLDLPDATARPREELAAQIPRRPRVTRWIGVWLALGFALAVTPAMTAERWLAAFGAARVTAGERAPITVRVPPFGGAVAGDQAIGGGGVIVARGDVATRAEAAAVADVRAAQPGGAAPYLALFALAFGFAALFSHHVQRSTRGRLVRVQIVSLAAIAVFAIAVKLALLASAASILVVPVALFAMVPTMVLDRSVGIATGILAAAVTCLLIPFDVTVAILLLAQAAAAGLVVHERPKWRWRAALAAGAVTAVLTTAALVLVAYLTHNEWPPLRDPLHSPWIAAAAGPALALVLAVPLIPLYQRLVGEITQGKLVALADLSQPLLRQIAERAPGTWQHSLMMANLAEIAANAIGANGQLVRVGAYYHDLGKSLTPKYFIENLESGEPSPHDQLAPEVSCDAIFAHVTEGIVAARRAGLHERIVDFMHMHHGNGVLEYFWGKTQQLGNPQGFAIERFRYPGHPPQSRETAILAICDAVEAASRTLKKPEPAAIESLVQRIVYGKLHLGQLDESGLSMGDLRRISDSLRETIKHANHGRIEYPWQKAAASEAAAAAGVRDGSSGQLEAVAPRLDSLDRQPQRDSRVRAAVLPRAEIVEDEPAEDVAMLETAPAQDLVASVRRALHEDDDHGRDEPKGPITQVGRAPVPDVRTIEPVRTPVPTPVIELIAEPPADPRTRAAALPAGLVRRAPTVPPPLGILLPRPPVRSAADDLDNAITNPPPLRDGRPRDVGELRRTYIADDLDPTNPNLVLDDVPRLRPQPTAEVDADQIEAAIELAPPARRTPAPFAAVKPKRE